MLLLEVAGLPALPRGPGGHVRRHRRTIASRSTTPPARRGAGPAWPPSRRETSAHDAPPALPDLDIRIEGAVAEVRLNRPAARNAFSLSLMRQLIEAAALFRASTEVQAVIVTGTQTYFSAGADLADPERAGGRPARGWSGARRARLGPDLCAAWESLEQVTIAAIEGYCIGGAAALAVSLDFRIAGEGAYLRLPEIALGMNMSWGALPRITALVGPVARQALRDLLRALRGRPGAGLGHGRRGDRRRRRAGAAPRMGRQSRRPAAAAGADDQGGDQRPGRRPPPRHLGDGPRPVDADRRDQRLRARARPAFLQKRKPKFRGD